MISSLLRQYHFRHLQHAKSNPRALQEKRLQQIISANRNTTFGTTHQFSRIRDVASFRRHVPIRNSKAYADYLSRCYQGEKNLLTREDPFFFAMTAGSTGDYKYIPLTRSFKKELDRSVFTFYHFLQQNCPEFQQLPIQFLVGSAEGGLSPGGVPQGFVSGFNYKNLPAFIRRKFIIPYWVFTLENADDRYYAMGRFLIGNGKVAALGAFSPLNINNIGKALVARVDELAKDIAKGTLTLRSSRITEHCKFSPDTALAQRVQTWQSAQRPTAELMTLLFPRLSYYATWMGGNMGYSKDALFQHMGKKPIHEMPFSASEGIFAIPFRLHKPGGIAAVASHFLEYIAEDDVDQEHPKAYGVWELEQGGHYYQVATTSAGLYRYNMEDLVRVSDFWGNIPVVEFISKRARQVSISNERINENDVTEACRLACQQTGTVLQEFVMFPTRWGHYRLLIEDVPADPQAFADAFERAMCALAKGYDFEREDHLLIPLELCIVQPGSLIEYVRSRQFRSTLPSAQFKPIHLSSDFSGSDAFTVVARFPAKDTYAGVITSPLEMA